MVAQIFRLTDKDSSSDEAKVSVLLARVKSIVFSVFNNCLLYLSQHSDDADNWRQCGQVVYAQDLKSESVAKRIDHYKQTFEHFVFVRHDLETAATFSSPHTGEGSVMFKAKHILVFVFFFTEKYSENIRKLFVSFIRSPL